MVQDKKNQKDEEGYVVKQLGQLKKQELVGLINLILQKLGIPGSNKYTLSKKNIPNKVKTSRNKGKSLCEEIEILLRHLELVSNEVTINSRVFL